MKELSSSVHDSRASRCGQQASAPWALKRVSFQNFKDARMGVFFVCITMIHFEKLRSQRQLPSLGICSPPAI